MTKSRFDRLMQSKQQKSDVVPNMIEIEGAFGCNYCEHTADNALYDPHRHLLVWECPDGHKNKMEDVHLG